MSRILCVHAKFGQLAQGILVVDHAGGIGRAVDDDGLGLGVMAARNFADVDAEIGIGVDEDRLAARHRDEMRIHDEVGIEEDHFIAGIERANTRARTRPPLVPLVRNTSRS